MSTASVNGSILVKKRIFPVVHENIYNRMRNCLGKFGEIKRVSAEFGGNDVRLIVFARDFRPSFYSNFVKSNQTFTHCRLVRKFFVNSVNISFFCFSVESFSRYLLVTYFITQYVHRKFEFDTQSVKYFTSSDSPTIGFFQGFFLSLLLLLEREK